jgi:molecular chaperone IbpA
MRTYDFSPLFRSTIGFDRLFDLAETVQRATDEGYPPYNIERLAEDRYQITLAVAGFSPDEVSVAAEQNVVTIEGGKAEKAEREFLYRGISNRLQAAIQHSRLRSGEGRDLRQWLAQDRAGPGNS